MYGRVQFEGASYGEVDMQVTEYEAPDELSAAIVDVCETFGIPTDKACRLLEAISYQIAVIGPERKITYANVILPTDIMESLSEQVTYLENALYDMRELAMHYAELPGDAVFHRRATDAILDFEIQLADVQRRHSEQQSRWAKLRAPLPPPPTPEEVAAEAIPGREMRAIDMGSPPSPAADLTKSGRHPPSPIIEPEVPF